MFLRWEKVLMLEGSIEGNGGNHGCLQIPIYFGINHTNLLE